MCQLVFRLRLCAQMVPLPVSPNPPTHPFTHCLGPSGWQHFTEGDGAAALSPWLVWGAGGGLTHLDPSPGADGAAPTPMGAGTRSGPRGLGKGSRSPAAPGPSWLRCALCARTRWPPGREAMCRLRPPPPPEQARSRGRPLGPPWPRARRDAPARRAPPRAVARPPSLAVFPSCTFKKTAAPWWDGVLKPHRGSYAARIRPGDKSPDGDRE